MPASPRPLPLAGIRVVDLSRILSGPYCTMTLADLGAEVIKIEPPQGDDTRFWGPPFVKGEATYFLSANRSKRSIVLDLKTGLGKRVLWDLLERADIAVENFRPGTLEKLGFGWEALHARTPRLILASISGYGQTGPLATTPGYDVIAQGEGGLMSVTGEPGQPPVKAGFSLADLGAGMWATIGILAALRTRDTTGEGDHIDVSLLETVLAWQTYQAEAYLVAGKVAGPMGTAHPTIAPYQTFKASDGYFNLAVGNDSLWQKFCAVLDALPEMAAAPAEERWYHDPALAKNADRVQVRPRLVERLNAIFRTRPRDEWLKRIGAAGIPAGSVNTIAESFVSPQVAARGMVQEVQHPTVGPMRVVRTPLTLTTEGLREPSAPPLLGADTADVMRELGYSPEEITQAWPATREAAAPQENGTATGTAAKTGIAKPKTQGAASEMAGGGPA